MGRQVEPKEELAESTPVMASTGQSSHEPPGVPRFRLRVLEGTQAGQTFESGAEPLQLGSHPLNQVQLQERTISRCHCEVFADARGSLWVKDLGSRNGTRVDGIRVREAELKEGALLELGEARLRFELVADRTPLALSERTEFGALVGESAVARACFGLLERAAVSDVTVLLEGETGTGKTQAAEAIHTQSGRQQKPFRIVDCAAVPQNLLESELFGHERGAFTGATEARAGVFEEASGGTVFLDEVGELAPELQPKLLRVLEARQVRRLGSNSYRAVDVRLIAATNRDLRAEVNAARFRPDLYFRIAVFRIPLPALRERPEDIPGIAERLLQGMALDEATARPLQAPAFLRRLRAAPWLGNVRELRNHLERCAVLQQSLHPPTEEATDAAPHAHLGLPYPEARRRTLDAFERAFVRALLERHQGNISQAALAGGVDRVHLHRLLKRHRLKP
ncbi:MAG: sigma 54-interacting transcriptional regulator [Myxococcaceae bacterium]